MNTTYSVVEEVRRLHVFFDDWFAGRPGRSIDEFSEALDEGFTIVNPHGSLMTADEIVGAVERRFGASEVAIAVENFDVRRFGDAYVCRYDEIQDVGGEQTRRVSTAVLVSDDATPGGLRWIAVHETWTVA